MAHSIASESFYEIRPMTLEDYDHGMVECLQQLTTVGQLTRAMFQDRWHYWQTHRDTYRPTCIILKENRQVIGTGMLILERKLIHSCALAGRIEDIVIHDSQRGKNLGKILIQYLTDLAAAESCYKVTLDCVENNKDFYVKCGYYQKGFQMTRYFIEFQHSPQE